MSLCSSQRKSRFKKLKWIKNKKMRTVLGFMDRDYYFLGGDLRISSRCLARSSQ